ncbi:alpha/beta hydrolase [Oceanirhabdus seepicola]|uniref:Alpha/beta hydrolase n=1 Tax=Oceanirhabdus seepicola TaxID=2828781 RepID=A0A9J6P449_9CLOT|nr:alpha/beta hydrolase [Oceanirhabdus seepicola]MCM1991487.1 alpha/beta hydrolase [Oceanirhabdus seepicola]
MSRGDKQVKFIKVNGKNIECLIRNAREEKNEGENTIIILPGMMDTVYEWDYIGEKISGNDDVIIVHREGLGNSELINKSVSTENSAEDLKVLLNEFGVKENIILVGHSYGGLIIQHFLKLFGNEFKIKGCVLVDPASINRSRFNEIHIPTIDEDNSDDDFKKTWERYGDLSPDDLEQEVNYKLEEWAIKLTKEEQMEIKGFYSNPKLYKVLLSEINTWDTRLFEIEDMKDQFQIPFKVFIRDKEDAIKKHLDSGIPQEEAQVFEDLWDELVTEIAEISTKSEIIIAEKCGHMINLDNPKIIIKGIKEIAN